MASSTLKTLRGFVRSVLERHTPLQPVGDSIVDIYNYVKIDERIATSGQPNERQFHLIREAGYGAVINLAPSSVLENSVAEEGAILENLGIEYVHIPIDFMNPTEDDFTKFVHSLDEFSDKKVWVHCAANARVSAFVYRYRCSVLGDAAADAGADLRKIWEPFGVWKKFIAR